MGNTRRFEIVVNQTSSVFYPGQCLQGQVHVELAENMRMKGIYITCRSSSEVQWRAGKHTKRGVEDYLNLKLTLFGAAERDGADVTLQAGNHVFPFQFVLPINLPGSYEGEYGCYVRHMLKAEMDRPWRFNKEYKMVFTVASILDLNAIPNAAAPIQGTNSMTSCCFGCCNDGAVTGTFRLDKSGFVPGESITVYGEIEDGANAGINHTVAQFVMRTVYTSASGCTKEEKINIGKLRHGRVQPGGTDVWSGEKIRIPPVPPSYLAGCNIIDIQYFLEVCADLGPYNKLFVVLPIIIGTVPLRTTVQQNRQRYNQNSANECHPNVAITHQPQGNTASAPPTTSDPDVDLPPPSYQECVFGKVNTKCDGEDYTAGNMNFAPSYTYYEGML